MDPGNTEDEAISAWIAAVHPISANELSTTTLIVDNSRNGADYKGLAFGTNTHGNFLFATISQPTPLMSSIRPLSQKHPMAA